MPSNFSNIGFQVGNVEELKQLTAMAAGRSTRVSSSIGGAYLHCASPEGAELWIQVSPDNDLIGCNPHFSNQTQRAPDAEFVVNLSRIISHDDMPLDGRLAGAIASEEACGCPIVFDVPDFRHQAAQLTVPTQARVQIAAFPRELTVSANEAEFNADQAGKFAGRGMAPESFIPSGMFKPGGENIEPPVAQAVLSGRILASERRVNSLGGRPFYALSVKTLGGVIDVPVDSAFVSTAPVVGGVIFGSFWLSGRLLEPLSAPPAAAPPVIPSPQPASAPEKKSKWKFW